MAIRERESPTLVTVQAAAPAVGSLDVTMLPAPSTATQKLMLGQEMAEITLPANGGWWSTRTGAAHPNGEVAFVGVALDWREACGFGPDELLHAAMISTTARTAPLM
jgi:hypothetical protein